MFLGKYEAALGEKKRITLPSKIVKYLTKQSVVIGKGFETCIYGYELGAWESSTRQYIDAPLLDKKARSVRRFIFSNSVVVPFDKQSRIVIPPFLIDYAGLSKEIIVVGSGDHFEIWDSLKWQKEWERLESIDE
ncbi:MAG: cell division protein MraZ, MraZ protein [Microgenomates group bacterium GW2011_GWC1_41_8]|uniref:Transcriptional regulator MraZ n=3 Tax=Candidatus Roizmaniibacteriota TaxID=1752723 RepID=A0A0G0ZEZ5_9BACT|nr:MAG: Protein MraZ [Candidatus Levybacteria bacterium GW2011_GWA2_40_16]KKR72584.1 MAG: Protein MraZ [Candidatus Roizmanbacteria bacterium GW2011_GWB1_40_7]KKR95025.1 MAG: Protein MraZ [Candidatus Roizmanbacteria bacterium GW2011_GWA1_41_13]KKS20606.1 MAG: Protein MraZ [Candidatus Roizmanbacteria bacterium GW2011_GWC2_41_7]KKS24779.1 MAG: cell division protein MraZ, MraZ protein [Microgenomates group bacterium GW2011_GWC1_41_8]OGK49066.1 MAG: division/cell wall cluster transcriptional repres